MKSTSVVLLAFIFLLTLPGKASAVNDETEIRSVVSAFCEALRNRSIDDLKSSTDWNWNDAGIAFWKAQFGSGEFATHPISGFAVKTVTINGSTATVSVGWDRTDASTGADYKAYGFNHRVIFLTRLPSGWKVLRFETAENDLINRILRSDSFEERQQMIRAESELNTHRVLFVILFRLRNDGKYDQTEEFYQLADWFNDEYYKGRDEKNFVNTQLNILNSKASTQVALGNIDEAVRIYLELARVAEDYQRRSGELVAGAALGVVNLGALYLRQGDLARAEYFANATLKMLEKADRVKQNVLFSSVYGLLGDIALRREQSEKAAEYFKKAGQDADFGRAVALAGQGKLSDAIAIFESISENFDRGFAQKLPVNLPQAIEVSTRLADAYVVTGSIDDAVRHATRAVRFADQLKNPEYRYAALTSLGRVRLRVGEFDAAVTAFRAAVEVIEAARENVIGNPSDRLFFFDNRTEAFQRLVEIAVRRGEIGRAFEISELGRARALKEIVRSGWFDWRDALSAADRLTEEGLRRKRYELNRRQTLQRLVTTTDQLEIEATNRAIESTRSEYEFFRTTAFIRNPAIRRSFGNVKPVTEATLLNLLRRRGEAILSFFNTEERTFLFVARQTNGKPRVDVVTLDASPKEIGTAVRRLRELIENRDLDFKPAAKNLYRILFAKASNFLSGINNFTIVPDGELWDVPFAALIDGNDRFMIESGSINIVQSLTALEELERTRIGRAEIDGILAFGNPKFDRDSLIQLSAEKRSTLGNLPEAEIEVNTLKSIFRGGSRVEIGSNAVEGLWKTEAGRFRYLHLATHGVTDPIEPLYSHLLLSTGNKNNDDGLLEAWEIMELKLNADLVVLSACETGRGRVGAGEGMIGLSWAFAVAGVPRVVSSQWMVNSASTSQLMIGFHRELRSRKSASVAEALRRSMIQTSRDARYRHPYYWAGFVSIGGR